MSMRDALDVWGLDGLRWSTRSICALAALLALAPIDASARQETSVGEVLAADEAWQAAAVDSQQRIDTLDDEARALFAEYSAELERLEDLEAYNANMRELLASQAAEKGRLAGEFDEIEVVRQAVVPLMVEMVDVLERFVAIDRPMLLDERRARVAVLRENLTRSNVELSEKFRRVVEAYQIEAEYGQSIEAYEGPVRVGDRELTVDFLRVGRVALYYVSLDRSEAGIWDQTTGRWMPIDEGDLDALDYALRLARKQAPPNLIELPLWTETPR